MRGCARENPDTRFDETYYGAAEKDAELSTPSGRVSFFLLGVFACLIVLAVVIFAAQRGRAA